MNTSPRSTRIYNITFLILLAVSLCNCQQKEDCFSDQPNILLILTDQLATGLSGFGGNQYLSTPAIDKLAYTGMVFPNAYVTQPLCLPSRSSLQTGRYPHEIGTINNGRKIKGDFPMLGRIMQKNGYSNKYIGKWHVGIKAEKAGYDDYTNAGIDNMKSKAAVEYLLNSPPQPFFLTVSYMNPHNVCELARGQKLPDGPIGVPPDDISQLPPLPGNFEIPENEPSIIRVIQDKSKVHYPTEDWQELEWRQYLWGYHRLVEKVDSEILLVINALSHSGLDENTVIIFTSDHGEGIAMHHWNQKQILYDQAAKVPLIITCLGEAVQPDCNALVSSSIDITSTILDIAGAEIPANMHGISLLPALKGKDLPSRDFIITETMFARGGTNLGATGRMIRTEQFKYCIYDSGENREQLFDMIKDPGEMENLAGDENYKDVLKNLKLKLSNWAKETGDDDFLYVESKVDY